MAASALGAQKLEFEAASIKVVPPGTRISYLRQNGGPGTKDPTTWISENTSIAGLVQTAYDIRPYQIQGADWMQNDRFIVSAKIAPGATKEQFREMLRNLLEDRFKLQVHHETKQTAGYVLAVAKGGPKFKETVPNADEPAPDPPGGRGGPQKDANGYPVFPAGSKITMANMMGKARFQYSNETPDEFAIQLSYQLHGPVVNQTGLTGKYDIAMNWDARGPGEKIPEGDERGPDLIQAVKEQLGLTLREEKVPVDTILIDHAEHVPAEN